MFKKRRGSVQNIPYNLSAPIGGLDAASALMKMPEGNCVILENWLPQPDGLEIRPGYVAHRTGFPNTVERLHVYAAANGGESLWATTNAGVYNATLAGAVGAPVIALTEGKTISTMIATGAGSFMLMVNGVDTLKQYDGTTWSSVATLGAVSTVEYSYVETYRQRIYLVRRNSLTIEYLAVNSISGVPTAFPLGAIFRQGGQIVAIGTWTIDGGVGPEDQLAVITNKGEVAVFAGSDPASAANWSFRGVYFIGRPLGDMCLFKYGGDLLVLTENGVYPLSSALQASAIERNQAITGEIRQIFSVAAQSFSGNQGWQIISDPIIPYLVVNIPSTPVRKQAVMHSQTGAWTLFSGWEAWCFARMGNELYFGTANAVNRVNGLSDAGSNIVATMLQAYSRLRYPRNKQIKLAKPYITSNGGFSYTMGIVPDFQENSDSTTITPQNALNAALWGTGLFGTAVWTGATDIAQDWQSVPDNYSIWKAFYLQVSSNNSKINYYGTDFLLSPGGNF